MHKPLVAELAAKQLPPAFLTAPLLGARMYREVVKPIVDLLGAAALLVCTAPIMILAAALIAIDSAGPVLYRQLRVGRNGRHFTFYKLRTMYDGADAGPFKTADADERITRLGRFLRDTKIDELPQLFNVLRGDMSIIGPRPLSVEETDHLIADGFSSGQPGLVPTVLPGITGLEQCTRSALRPYEHRFWLNRYYEENISYWLDSWVIKRTLCVCPLVSALIVACVCALLWLFSNANLVARIIF